MPLDLGPRILGRAFYLGRVDARGEVVRPRGLRRGATRLNQAIVERGRRPPWVWSQERCQAYWGTRVTGGGANDPAEYAAKPLEIVTFMNEFWAPEVGPLNSVLELGPNAGANLEGLRRHGYGDLRGIEINPAAVEQMRSSFPELARRAKVEVGEMERLLPAMADASVDVVFTMGVLMHVHPSGHEVFGEIARVAARHVCVIETETANNPYVFARNYRRVFERLGCHEVRSVTIDREVAPQVERSYDGLVARLFTAP